MSPRIKRIITSHALTGFICWYGIEKVFQKTIGITTLGVSVLAIVYITISALLNVPTGVLADKFGRKYAIILATIVLLFSTITASLAHNIWQYLVSIVLWGIFYTTQNGAYEALMYDTLKEEGKEKSYARLSGLSNASFWVAIFSASIIGAWVGSHSGLRWAYLITIIPNVLNIGLAFSLYEPKRHKHDAIVTSFGIAKQGLQFLASSSKVMQIGAIFLLIQLFGWTTNEFGQLFFIELGFSVLLVGLLNAASGLFQAVGNFIGHKFHKVPIWSLVILIISLFILTFALPVNLRVAGIALFLVVVFVRQVLYIKNNTELQHTLPSEIRATVLSTLGMLNDGLLIGTYLCFGLISKHQNVRSGYLVVAGFGCVLLVVGLFLSRADFIKRREFAVQNAALPLPEVDSVPR
jgi:MFS family permease